MEKLKNPTRRNLFRGKLNYDHVLRLPWVTSEEKFIENCSQCQDCINVCETNILVKDAQGFPKVDFSKNECTFCKSCLDVCQQSFFMEDKTLAPWPAKVHINNKCFAHNNIYCQSCQDICQSAAISFPLENSSIPKPQLNLADCNSCGACISTCPQDAIAFIDEREVKYV